MEPERAAQFLQAVEEEREIVLTEFKSSPESLKRRLGLTPALRPMVAMPRYQRQTIGEMAVRTAIQATIWETIVALFRR
jgi:hypothetical protein